MKQATAQSQHDSGRGSRGIAFKLAAIQLLALLIVGSASYFAGQGLLLQVAGLARDEQIFGSLNESRRALATWNKERQALASAWLEACAIRDASLSTCVLPGISSTSKNMADPEATSGWLDGETYLVATGEKNTKVHFAWLPIKDLYEKLSELIATRDHVRAVLPDLTRSFTLVFSLALGLATLIAIGITFILSKRLTGRVAELIDYTTLLGQGRFALAPAATAGDDEVGLLALALERMAKDLEEARSRLILTEKMTSWQNVARKVAHEIKNPLTPIGLVASELERRSNEASENLGRFLLESGRILQEETSSLQRMVREFTAFARLPQVEVEACDFKAVLLDFIRRNEAASGPLLRLQASTTEPFPVDCDRGMIHQILHNLVGNARIAKHPARVTIDFELRHDDRQVHLLVRDDGPGIPAEIRSSLFDAYVTSRSTGDQEKGMGLGLAISSKIAYDHGGALTLVTTGPQGTIFKLTLPRKGASRT